MIRQAISCDVCGAEKKQTNHWFVASEAGGELRLSGWSSRTRQRAGTKHLCGQTCLHKLADEFMARTISGRVTAPVADSSDAMSLRNDADASLVSAAAYCEGESPARRIAHSAPPVCAAANAPRPNGPGSGLVAMQPRLVTDLPAHAEIPPQPEDQPNYASRRWRAEAWERERNRELRGADRHSEGTRRRSRF